MNRDLIAVELAGNDTRAAAPRSAPRRWLGMLVLLLLLLCHPAGALALGGDYLSPFPVTDSLASRQEARTMAVDGGGNVVVVGYTTVSGMNNDYQITKFKADGSGIAWRATFDKAGGDDQARAVVVDGNNDLLVTGTVWNGTSVDIHTVKYSGTSGTVLWQHTWSGVAGGNDAATAITVDSANNVYVAGYTANAGGNDDYLILKYPATGATPTWQEIWNASYNSNDRIAAIAAGGDGIVVTGASAKAGTDFDILTRKYGFDRSFIWEQRANATGSGDDRGVAVRMDSSGHVFVAGYRSNGIDSDIYVARYAAAAPGAPVWEKTYAGNGNDEPKAIWLDGTTGDLYVTGYTYTYGGNEDVYTARYGRGDGTLLWSARYHSAGDFTDIPVGMVVGAGADGDVFVAGYTVTTLNENITVLKYKKGTGELAWQQNYNGPANKSERPVGIGLDSAGEVVVAGWSDTLTNAYDFLAIKYDFGRLDPPTGLTATATANETIALSWRDNSTAETLFKIERKLGQNGTYAQINTVSAGVTTYVDDGLIPNNYYYYRVRAYNGGTGTNSYYSTEAHALTKVVSYENPAWTYQYNGADNREDEAVVIVAGADDHPIVTGYSDLTEEGVEGAYSFDYLTVKLDRADKSVKWRARYDSGDGGTDMAAGLVLDGNGDAIITGTSYLSGGTDKSDDLFTIKYRSATHTDPNSNPPLAWSEQYGTQAGIDQATAIQTVRDGSDSVVVIGHGINTANDEDMFIIKYRADGTTPWPPIVFDGGTAGNDYPSAVALDSAGNIIITGSTENAAGNFDIYTAKYNGATGALLWSRTYAGAGNGDDHGLSLAVDAKGDVYVTGYGVNAAGNEEWVTKKYAGADSAPQRLLWQSVWNGLATPVNGNDRGIALAIDPIDGAVVVAGTAYVSATDSDFHLVRYRAADGEILWERNFDRPASYDYVTAMSLDSSGYIYLAGNSRSGLDSDPGFDSSANVLALIYDFEGTFLGATRHEGPLQDEARSIAVNYQGEAFVAGMTRTAANPDYLVLKQKNSYILVPAPLTVTPQADYATLHLSWRENTPGTSFQIDRTPAPVLPTSVWTPVATPASGTTSVLDNGLNAGSDYCYRITAFTGSFSSRTIVQCRTTTLRAPTLSPLTVDGPTQLTVTWSQVLGATGYKIERKIGSGAWAELNTLPAGTTTFVDKELTPGTTYAYRVSVQSASGWSLPSSEQLAPTLPAAPVMAATGIVTITTAVLNWTNVAGESGYRLERKLGSSGTWAEIKVAGVDELTYADSGLTANSQYYYRVRAYNAAGNSVYSSEQPVLTRFVSPTLTSATGSATDKISLVWTPVPNSTGYTIQYVGCSQNGAAYGASYCTNTGYYGSSWSPVTPVDQNTTAYSLSALTAGYAYRFRIIATTAGNSSDPSNDRIGWTWMTGPTMAIAPASETALMASWGDISGETNYTLERKQGAGGTWAEVVGAIGMGVNTTAKQDSGLSLSTEYCYRVKAYSTNLNGPPAVYSSNAPCLTTPLAAPVQNAPTGITDAQVDLSWSPVSGSTGYEVQRCQFVLLDNPEHAVTYLENEGYWNSCVTYPLAAANTTYRDSGLGAGYTYRYRVRDTFIGGTSAWSNARVVTTIPATPALYQPSAASTSQLNISFGGVFGETGFSLQWKQRSGSDCTAGSWSGPIAIGQNQWSYPHSGLTAGTYYCYRISAGNAAGSSVYSAAQSQVTLPVAPVLDPVSGVTISRAVLSWTPVTGNAGYKIERKTGSGGAWSTIFTTATNALTYPNEGLSAGTEYFYRLSASNAAGSSLPSNEVATVTTPAGPSVSGTTLSAARIDLAWPVVLGATNYKLERKAGAGSYSEQTNLPIDYREDYCGFSYPTVGCAASAPAIATFQDQGLTENTTYCYRLRAWNVTGGDSLPSQEKCATTLAIPGQILTLTPLNSFKIRLDWSPVVCTPNPCDPPEGYEIERMMRDGVWLKIATVGAGTATFADRLAIDPNRQYRYRIRSYSGAFRSPYAEAAVYTPPYRAGDNVEP